MNVIGKSKDEIRKSAKDLRVLLGIKRLKEISTIIESKIKDLDEYKKAINVMSYCSKELEISLDGLLEDKTKKWFLPVTKDDDILVVPYEHGKTKLQKGNFGIQEPEIIGNNFYDQKNKKVNLDLIFVPGLCFDKKGYRVGFGKGYYDRFLKLNPEAIKIGTCPSECIIDEFLVDDWDVKVDLMITEL